MLILGITAEIQSCPGIRSSITHEWCSEILEVEHALPQVYNVIPDSMQCW